MSTTAQPDATPFASVAARLTIVRERIAAAAIAVERDPREVRLLAATKTQTPDTIDEALRAGVDLIGENRVQELVAKAPTMAERMADGRLEVHMIGALQRNKINQMLASASCLESLHSLDLAQAISQRCLRDGRTGSRALDVMVQVNVTDEGSKSGVAPCDAMALCTAVAAMPGLRLTGLMTIGARLDRLTEQNSIRAGFAALRMVRDEVLASGVPGTSTATELSMGMSADLEVAIAEGATIVRLGTAVFGSRPQPHPT